MTHGAMTDLDKIKAYVKATGLHAAEGVEFGIAEARWRSCS